MQHSENINEIATALSKAQGEIKGAVKDSENPHFKSRYADLASVWDACRTALSANGIAVIQAPTSDHEGNVCVETLLTHSSGQWMRSDLSVRPAKADAQAVGSVITYLRRYALAAMVGVAPEDDDGEAATGRGNGRGGEPMEPVKREPAKQAARGNGTPALTLAVPDEPGIIPVPVPENGDMQPVWKAWVMAMQMAIHNAPDIETLDMWVAENQSALGNLKAFNVKTFAYIDNQIEARRGALAQAPISAAAE